MSISLTDEQFCRVLKVSTNIAKKKWQHSTDLKTGEIVGNATDKELTITKIETLLKEDLTEEEYLEQLKTI